MIDDGVHVPARNGTHQGAQDEIQGEIIDELTIRFRSEAPPEIEEFARRYPDQVEEIRRIFPALETMVRLEHGTDSSEPLAFSKDPMALDSPTAHRRLGDFRIVEEIGRGGMSVVYEAEQISLGRRATPRVDSIEGSI